MTETLIPVISEFVIPEENMPILQDKVAKLSRKAVKITGKGFDFRVVEEIRKPAVTRKPTGYGHFETIPLVDADGNRVFDIFYKVAVEAVTPKIDGWTFIATIDHSQAVGNLIHISPICGLESVPEKYRSVPPRCDHCKSRRIRKDTFLLREDKTGTFKQIGRQCLRDFIGYDVAGTVAMEEMLRSLADDPSDDDLPNNLMRDDRVIMVRSYLTHVAAMIRKHGWRSKTEARRNDEMGNYAEGRSTASMAMENMFRRPVNKDYKNRVALIDKDVETADAALDWARTMTPPRGNDYLYNLSVIAKSDIIEYRSAGILASLITAYARAKEQEIKRAERRSALNLQASQHVGKEGHRLRDISAILYGYYPLPDHGYGPQYIYRFRTDDGNVLVWKASASAAEKFDAGAKDAANRIKVRITGTVKRHSEYQDVKQTDLTRCSIERVEQEDAE